MMQRRPEISKRRRGNPLEVALAIAWLAALGTLTAACDRPPAPASEASGPELPEPGTAVVRLADGRCTVLANAVDRLELLHRVSECGGFRIVAGEVESSPVTVRAIEVAPEEAVALILEGIPYEIGFAVDPSTQLHVLEAVTVGDPGELPAIARRLRERRERLARLARRRRVDRLSPEERERRRVARLATLPPEERERLGRRREALLAALSPEERERFLEEGRASVSIGALSPERREEIREKRRERLRERRGPAARLRDRRQQQTREERGPEAPEPAAPLAERLSDPDRDVRAGAVGELQLNPETVRKLGEILEGDPDPGVRADAARRLAFAESFRAGSSLLDALGDPDPGVVIAAIEALEFVGDSSVLPELNALSEHPDRTVRQRAAGAVEFLR